MLSLLRRTALTILTLPLLTGCGSGFVAIFSSDGSSAPRTVPPPPNLVTNIGITAPLLPPTDFFMEIVVQNYVLPADISRVRVEIRAFGNVVDEQLVLRATNSSTLEFVYGTTRIRARSIVEWGEKATEENDVPASIAVLVDGEEVAPPIGVVLLRQPRAQLDSQKAHEVLSPLGQSLVVRVQSISLQIPDTSAQPGTKDYTDDLVRVNTMRARVALGNDFENEIPAVITKALRDAKGDLLVTIAMPAVEAPIQAHYVVDSIPSGRSTLVSNSFYRPEIFGTSPATGASEGGAPVVLFGKALVPRSETDPSKLDFDRLTLSVEKGGRRLEIDSDRIQQDESNSNRIVFPMPAAPDGRPGPANVFLGLTLDALNYVVTKQDVKAEAIGVFTYRDTNPYFGPRGALMRNQPAVVRFDPFVDASRPAADAMSVYGGPAGMPYAVAFRTRGNGLFTRFGQPLRAGITSDPFQRHPIDFCIADFVGNGTRAGVILNQGFGEYARHGMILGSGTSNPPMIFNEDLQLAIEESGRACGSGDFNKDKIADLVVLAKPLSLTKTSDPLVFLSDGSVQTGPRFGRAKFSSYAGPFDFTALDVDDLDSDGNLDLVFAACGLEPRLLIAFGTGDGQFPAGEIIDLRGPTLDFKTAGYTPDVNSKVIGVHAIGPKQERSIVMVLSGVANSSVSPPAVVFVRRGTKARTFEALKSSDVVAFGGIDRVNVASTAGDLTGDSVTEFAVATAADKLEPIRVFARGTNGVYSKVPNAVDLGSEELAGISGLGIGVVTSPGSHRQANGRRALFVTHQHTISSSTEYRVSTFLIDPAVTTPKLLSPHGSREVSERIRGLAVGEFFPQQSKTKEKALDVYAAVTDGLISFKNDGLGELKQGATTITTANILPESLTTVFSGSVSGESRQSPAFLTEFGFLGLILPTDPQTVIYAGDSTPVDLRTFAPEDPDPTKNLRTRPLQINSMITYADVNLDGFYDLVVLVGLASGRDPGEEGESLLLLMLGKANPAIDEFPFELPDAAKSIESLTHGNVSSVGIGDFAPTLGKNHLELAVALPLGGSLSNEVRFYRWDPAKEKFTHSFVSANHHALPVGNEPVQIVAADYNSDGRTDIAVASRKDHSLWIFYNFSSPGLTVNVDLTRFQGAPTNPLPLPIGDPLSMTGTDINGDNVPDALLVIDSATSPRDQQVVYYLSPGSLGGSALRSVMNERTGNRIMSAGKWVLRDAGVSARMGDLNGDGAPDMILGWDTTGPSDYNLRVLFGNNF